MLKCMERDEILLEVRRQAALNGNAPLGKKRFAEASGIPESAWSGKYWARWSDLLADAGLRAGEMQHQKVTEVELIECLAAVASALGRFPTMAELKLRRRMDSDFPSANVFTSRLGSRGEMIAKVFDFALSNAAHAGLVDILRGDIETGKVASSRDEQPSTPGRVYLLRNGKHYKIGKTDNLDQRIRHIRLAVPGKLELLHELETDDPTGIELYWHRRFASKRIEGEWFRLDSSDVAAFRRRGKFM